jgi:copper chaperone CopZ
MRAISLDVGVGGLSCGSCAASPEVAVSHRPGGERVTVDLAMGRVIVAFDADATSMQAIAKVISVGLVQGGNHDGMGD